MFQKLKRLLSIILDTEEAFFKVKLKRDTYKLKVNLKSNLYIFFNV